MIKPKMNCSFIQGQYVLLLIFNGIYRLEDRDSIT